MNNLRARLLAYEPVPFTNDDLLRLFVRREHRGLAVEAATLFHKHSSFERFFTTKVGVPVYDQVAELEVYPEIQGSSFFMFPNYIGSEFYDAEQEEKLVSWTMRRVALGQQLGTINALLIYFNHKFESEAAVRYVWPGLIGLCKLYPSLASLEEKIAVVRPMTRVPSLPLAVAEAVKMSTVLITKGLLLSELPMKAGVALKLRARPVGLRFPSPWQHPVSGGSFGIDVM